jgi:hypothetical protein
MIKTVIRAANNMVIVFDERGRQLPGYQGQYEDVKQKILADTRDETGLVQWFGVSPEPHVVSRVDW